MITDYSLPITNYKVLSTVAVRLFSGSRGGAISHKSRVKLRSPMEKGLWVMLGSSARYEPQNKGNAQLDLNSGHSKVRSSALA